MKFWYVFCVALVFSSCTRSFDQSDLPGTYVATYSFGKDKIVIQKDGTYLQEVRINNDTAIYRTSGKWQYDNEDGYITIEDPIIVSNGFGGLGKNYKRPSNGDMSEPVERDVFDGHLRLGPDEGNPLDKISE